MVTARTGFTLRERAPAGGVDGDAGPKPRRRHRAVERHERLQPRRRRGRRPAPNQRPLREHARAQTPNPHPNPIRRSPAGQCRYLRRIRAERRAAAEGDAREGNGATRARPVRGAERAADLTAVAAAAAARARDAISSPHSCLRAELASNSSGRSVYLVCLFRE